MKTKVPYILFFAFVGFIWCQCDDGYTEYENECYYNEDLNVLQEFINNSQNGDNPPPFNMLPIDLGVQVWENGRLVKFKCSTLWPTYLDYELSGDVPPSLSTLEELTELYINANELINLPNDIGNLMNLELLEMSGNNFSSLPGSIGNLYNLEWLYIYNNQITYLPESLCNILDSLNSISLEYNLLCPETYPECIEEYLSIQDTSNCFEICEGFNIYDIQIIQDTEWGDLLYIDLYIPEVSIYGPYFFLQTDDEYLNIMDPEASFFYITGPTTVDLFYYYNYDYIPENHIVYGNINMIASDEETLTCDLPFNVTIPNEVILGDINDDEILDVLDIVLMINMILSNEYNVVADVNEDGSVDILDVIVMVNILVGGLP